MSRFYGTLEGAGSTESTRTGHDHLEAHVASWQGAVRVCLFKSPDKSVPDAERDTLRIEFVPWQGHGVSKLLYLGPVDPAVLETQTPGNGVLVRGYHA